MSKKYNIFLHKILIIILSKNYYFIIVKVIKFIVPENKLIIWHESIFTN
jgi:hypothetical protein